jgi:hypothetical protein
MKSLSKAIVVSVAAFLLASLAASAAAPNVALGTAVVNGSASEWGTLNSSNPAWFSEMCGGFAATCDAGHPATSNLFLRYDCNSGTLYALDSVIGNNTVDTSANQFIAQDTAGNKLVSNTSGNDGVAPDFQYIGNVGWEMSVKLAPNTAANPKYSLWFEATVGGTTSGTHNKFTDVVLTCAPSAVTVASLSADATDSRLNLALVALSAAGLVVLGGLVCGAARKR